MNKMLSVIFESWFLKCYISILHNRGTIAEMGVCSYLYDRKGAIYVHAVPMNQKENAEFEKLEFEKVFELAIEAGAEEVFEDVDENNEQMFKVLLPTWCAKSILTTH